MEKSQLFQLLTAADQPASVTQFASIKVQPERPPSDVPKPNQKIDKGFMCETCSKTFTTKYNLTRHLKTHLQEKSHVCDICQKGFSRKDDLTRHKKHHPAKKASSTTTTTIKNQCHICMKIFGQKFNLDRHMKTHDKVGNLHGCQHCAYVCTSKEDLLNHVHNEHSLKRKNTTQGTSPKRCKKELNRSEALNVFSKFKILCDEENEGDFIKFFEQILPTMSSELQSQLQEKKAIKWYADVRVLLSKTSSDGEIDFITPHFRSRNYIELMEHTLQGHIQEALVKIQSSFDEFTRQGSGWVLERIEQLEVCTAQYHPLAASSYIPLPKKIADKKAVLNIENIEDNKCLIWCLLAHQMNIHWEDHPHRVSHYTAFENEIQLGDIQCPVPVCRISKIEELNNLRINIFGYEDEVFPLYISPKEDIEAINLLLITTEDSHHYCLIRNFSRLLGDLTKHDGKSHYCYRCLHRFSRADLLKDHLPYCKLHVPQRIKMPELGDHILKFDNVHYQQPIPYVIYADFESLIIGIDQVHAMQNTQKIARHEACGYSYLVVGPDGKSKKPISTYRGPNAVDHFLESILQEKQEIADIITKTVPICMSPQEEHEFKMATHCYLCKKALKQDRVRDHCHLTGKYRGPLHNRCNLKFRLQKKIPVIFHNLKHYDGHLIMQKLGKIKDHHFNVIPTTMEKYINFSLSSKHNNCHVNLSFMDSYQFMASSLEKLVENLEECKFSLLKEHFPNNIQLLLRKGVYPYEFMNSFDKFKLTELPPIETFHSTLTGCSITPEDYVHAQNVWQCFNVANMGEYHDLYVKTDVLQLADVFENFRKLCLDNYGLDCVHLLTAPGLAWQSCLKMCDTPLELLTDVNMHMFIEKGIRGGISVITKRSAQANNKYLPNYNPEEPSKHIIYLDCNNLYGWAMSQPLPWGEFEWVSTDNINAQWIQSLPDDGPEGFIFEVDLDYPNHLHEEHNDYPLAAEKMQMNFQDLSSYSLEALQNNKYLPSVKLVPNLKKKTNYVVYYKNLKFYLQKGLKLTKVHKALKFKEKAWLKPYIDFNTNKRKMASSAFEKLFFKLMNNAVYGKSMENVRKHKNVSLINDEKKGKKLVSAPSFKRFSIFDHDLVAIERLKQTLTLDKPIYMGFVILELSKLLMYDFHYNHIKKQYSERAQLLFTDTDSLTYEIQTEDIYKDMSAFPHIYDTSDYPTDHPLYTTQNKKKIGCFKDEMNSKPIQEFIGLRAKMYSILSPSCEKKTAKGVSRGVVERRIKHADYKSCLESLSPTREELYRIQSEKHHLHTVKYVKTALSPFDDKRYILEDGVCTLAHGHFKIPLLRNM